MRIRILISSLKILELKFGDDTKAWKALRPTAQMGFAAENRSDSIPG